MRRIIAGNPPSRGGLVKIVGDQNSPTEPTLMVDPSDVAPSFQLPNQDGHSIDLKDFLGRWVALYFYPRDDTPG